MTENKKTWMEGARIALVLLVICAVVAGVVALVYGVTAEPYEKNRQEEIRRSIVEIFADDGVSFETTELENVSAAYIVKKADDVLGYCLGVSGNGFGGEIQLMIGYDKAGAILGIRAIANVETTGFSKADKRDAYLAQYEGKSGTLEMGRDVDAIAGATVSSKAVLAAVNTAGEALASLLEKEAIQ